MKRSRVLFGVLGFAALLTVGGWAASLRIESPADVAARAAPPSPSPILVPIEERVLSSNIVTRGTARFGLPQPISIVPSALKAKAGLITTLPLRNTQLREGSVMLTASGRPLFVLQGRIPAYRDLVPGTSGDDVRQLEQALQRLGFDPGPVDGTYDEHTSAAATRWYTSAGFEPYGPTRDQRAAMLTLERDWAEANKIKLTSAAAASAAALAVESARATAEQNNRVAAAALEAKRAEWRRLAQASASGTSLTVESARATAAQNNRVAAATLEAKRAEWRRLAQASASGTSLTVESARATAELNNRAAAAALASAIAERAMIVLDPRQPETARAAAETKVELARAAVHKTKLDGELTVQAAERDAVSAVEQRDLAEAAVRSTRLEGEKAVQAALDAQRAAERDAVSAVEQRDLAEAAVRSTRLEGGRGTGRPFGGRSSRSTRRRLGDCQTHAWSAGARRRDRFHSHAPSPRPRDHGRCRSGGEGTCDVGDGQSTGGRLGPPPRRRTVGQARYAGRH